MFIGEDGLGGEYLLCNRNHALKKGFQFVINVVVQRKIWAKNNI